MALQELVTLVLAVWGAVLATAIFILDRVARRPRLRVSITEMHAIDLWDKSVPTKQIVLITITNVGAIEVLVKHVGFESTEGHWLARLYRKQRQYYFWKCRDVLDNLPKVVEPRRQVHFCIPADKFWNPSVNRIKSLKHVRLVVSDSLRKSYRSAPLEKTLRRGPEQPKEPREDGQEDN